MRTWETLRMGDELEAEVGAEQVVARFARNSPNTVVAALPYVTAGWRSGDTALHYGMTTIVPGVQHRGESEAAAWLPALSVHKGALVLERGLHQELGWDRKTETSGIAFVVYADHLDNPVVEAMTHLNPRGAAQLAGNALIDPASGIMRAAGPAFSTTGFMATAERHVRGDNEIRVSFANGDALVMPAVTRAVPFSGVLASVHPRRVPMYSISLSGTLEGTGTRWHASYRWQPEDTVTQVAPFAANAAEPYFNLHFRQPVTYRREGQRRVDVMVDVHNLLAQGFRPFFLGDGSVLLFAQDQRSFSGGFAFTF